MELLSTWLHIAIDFIVLTVKDWGYWGVFALMFLEGTFFPFPSEVVMIPAGYLAYKGDMSLLGAIFVGTAGSLGGALFNYYSAILVGRQFILRFGKYFFVGEKHLLKMEAFFKKHGSISTFTGRLIVGVRQLISLPAGLARMPMGLFIFYTTLGSCIWVSILVLLGYFVGHNEALVKEYLEVITLLIVGAVIVLIGGYIFLQEIHSNTAIIQKIIA